MVLVLEIYVFKTKSMAMLVMELPHDPTLVAFSFLDAKELLTTSRCCKAWAALAAVDTLWGELCGRRWDGKKYVPAFAPEIPWRQRYMLAEVSR